MQILKEQTRLIQQLLPMGAKNKPGRSMTPKYITMHNTGNTAKGADAKAHAGYLSSGASGQKVSWHYTVDDEVIYQHLSDTEQGWHAADGRGPGNSQSIGIEVCMFEGSIRPGPRPMLPSWWPSSCTSMGSPWPM